MRLTSATPGGAALLVLLTVVPTAHATPILWSYSWSRSPTAVTADSPGTGYITLTDEGLKNAGGNSDIVATNLRAYSTATSANPDVFTNKPFTLSLFLQDSDTGKSTTIKFQGVFNGLLTALSSNVKATFLGLQTVSVILGQHQYTVTIGPYVPPGPPSETNVGSIGAHADVKVSLVHMPEPGSLTLLAVGVGMLGLVRRRRTAV